MKIPRRQPSKQPSERPRDNRGPLNLTPQERRQIYLEEKTKIDTRRMIKEKMEAKKKTKKKLFNVFLLFVVLPFLVSFFLTLLDNDEKAQETPEKAVVKNTPEKAVLVESLVLGEDAKYLSIETIKQYRAVVGASISQEGREVRLVVVVKRGTSRMQARKHGEDFVRLVKLHGGIEPLSGISIGTGKFDYLVGVIDLNHTTLAEGSKVSRAERMTW